MEHSRVVVHPVRAGRLHALTGPFALEGGAYRNVNSAQSLTKKLFFSFEMKMLMLKK